MLFGDRAAAFRYLDEASRASGAGREPDLTLLHYTNTTLRSLVCQFT
jgi:hypothetical protein